MNGRLGLATGVSWRRGEAFVRLVDDDGAGRRLPVRLGERVGWQVDGPRRCTGVWLPDIGERRSCPNGSTLAGTSAASQCPDCAVADPGRALARNFAVDDPRPFRVYLAWFGDGLVKVGLTAVEREADRLAEQGALAYTWLAQGPFVAARRLEHAAATAGTAQERIPRSGKLAGWWQLDATAAARHDQLAAVHLALTTATAWPDDLQPVECAVHDLTALYGLDAPLPASVREVVALADGAVVGGEVKVLAGHDALLDTDDGTLLVDLRRLAGWTLAPSDQAPAGLETVPFDRGDTPEQGTLFA